MPLMAKLAPEVASLMLTLLYDTFERVAVCPDGHEKPTLAAEGGVIVKDPEMFPFLSALNWPEADTSLEITVFFGSDVTLLPPLTHSNVRGAVYAPPGWRRSVTSASSLLGSGVTTAEMGAGFSGA